MKSKTTRLAAYPYRPSNVPDEEIVVEFGEKGWKVITDTRNPNSEWFELSGYLHYHDELSAPEITDAVRDEIIKYYYNHPQNMPGIGATPQTQYMSDLSIEERERIGNNGKQAFYA